MSLDVSTKNNSRRKNYIAHSVRALLGPPSKTCYKPYEPCYKPLNHVNHWVFSLKNKLFSVPMCFLKHATSHLNHWVFSLKKIDWSLWFIETFYKPSKPFEPLGVLLKKQVLHGPYEFPKSNTWVSWIHAFEWASCGLYTWTHI